MITKITQDNIRDWEQENEYFAQLAFETFKKEHQEYINI